VHGDRSDAAETAGEATVYLDRGATPPHASIEVQHGGASLHTEQAGTTGTDAVGQNFAGELSGGPVFKIRIPVPNAARAQAYQRATEGYTFGPYDYNYQSCVTYCANVLRAGGVEGIPEDTNSILRWLWVRH
jgi:hypothetical protein